MSNIEQKLKDFGQKAKKLQLTASERQKYRYELVRFMEKYEETQRNSIFSLLFRRLRPVYLSIAILSLFGTGVVFAAQNSLPGDFFYPLKIQVLEKAEGLLATSHEQKAKLAERFVHRRLQEAETLMRQNRLNPQVKHSLDKSFKKEVQNTMTEIDALKADKHFNAANEATSHLSSILQTHRQILHSLEVEENHQNEDKIQTENHKTQQMNLQNQLGNRFQKND